ncbi:MAG: hypothetical protein HKN47_17540 [Pirellulaceae bacterium]|nr:hypothetical protein [Pirellulaceae bacterium]
MYDTTETNAPEFQTLASDRPRIGDFAGSCPECEASIHYDGRSRGSVVACPGCGQCLDSPQAFGLSDWSLGRPHWPFSRTVTPGSVEVAVAIAIGGLALIDWFSINARLAALFVSAGLLAEGISRLHQLAIMKQTREANVFPALPSMPGFGSLCAVFRTRNSVLDSVAITGMVGALGCGLMWVIELVAEAKDIGDDNLWKGILCLGILPAIMIYGSYRAIRLNLDRRAMYVYQKGVRYRIGEREESFTWQDVKRMTAIHLGDAIDEDAIDIEFTSIRKKIRITRAQFPLIEFLWQRLLQEAQERIASAHIEIRTEIATRPNAPA